MVLPPSLTLPRAFFARDARVVARALVGARLARRHETGEVQLVRIVETEAYRGPTDAACHARFGETKRTRALFGPPGHAYVFLIYGMYDCFNVTCFGEGRGHAVLVRAVEPIAGVDVGLRTDGPGRLTRALAITRAHDGADLCDHGVLTLFERERTPRIVTTARVGVGYAGEDAEAPYRFFDAESRFVSKPSAKMLGLGVGAVRPARSSTSKAREPRPSGRR